MDCVLVGIFESKGISVDAGLSAFTWSVREDEGIDGTLEELLVISERGLGRIGVVLVIFVVDRSG